MTNYELSVILPGTLSEDLVKEAGVKIGETIKGLGGEIKRADEPSHKRLAYAIKKIRNGIYLNFYLEMNPAMVLDLEKKLKLISEVVRYQVSKPKRAPVASPRRSIFKKETATTTEEYKTTTHAEAKKMSMEDLDKKLDEILGEEVSN
ncbi:MAG: 30S ribosomal protein S6 [Patescibacteria group bacterium]|nr:30S ribosomal protein S6 [Patescibacteria group bacterium]